MTPIILSYYAYRVVLYKLYFKDVLLFKYYTR